ncbi:MAG: hypothetical protein IPN11_15325 [Opitutaceae bacterium]|nr:hypothetical protein [Opitutaceae bacterium]
MNDEEAYQEASAVVLPDGQILVEGAVIRPWPSLQMAPVRSLAFTEEILRAVPGSRFWPAARVIPSEVRKLAWLTPSHAWGMAELCAVNHARGLDLVSNCPALAILICEHYVPDRDGDYWDYLSSMLGKTWRQLLAVFELPVRPRTIRILCKLDRAHCRAATIHKLCAELRKGNRWLCVLPHLSRITRDTVALLHTKPAAFRPHY